MKPTATTSVLDANGCKIIWGFLLENTLFTEFEEHNHAIIETAYRQRKKKQASHYIVIVDANLPKPCKAKVYFGVVQNHLRMPGTRYYVTRHVVRPNATSTSNITTVKSSSLAPPPPILMPSPMSTTSSSTSSSDTVCPPLDPSIAALFSDDPSFSPSASSSTSTDSANTFNSTSIDKYLSNGAYCNNFLLDVALGKSIPHSFNDNYSSFFNTHYGTTDIYNDQNNVHQFMNNNVEISNHIGNVYIASNDGVNYLDQITCHNNLNEESDVILSSNRSNSNNMQQNVKIPSASCRKRSRQDTQPSLGYSSYQHQALYNYQSSNNHQQHNTTRNHVHKYNIHDNTMNANGLGSSTDKHVEAISDDNSLLVGNMSWLSFWDFSSIDNSAFQELVSWPVFDGPKPNYGQKQGSSSAIYHTF